MSETHDSLRKKIVVVTGAASGIGRGIARHLLSRGSTIITVDRDRSGLKRLQSEADDRLAHIVTADLANAEGCASALESIRATGLPITSLVNCAGVGTGTPYLKEDYATAQHTMAINVLAGMELIRGLVPAMVDHGGGSIVNVASVAAQLGGGIFGNTLYAASKGAILALTRGIAREFGPSGVRCNSVVPGPVVTPMNEHLVAEHGERVRGMVPLGRFGRVEDVAAMIAFLLSDEAEFISGAMINVDGGIARP